MQVFVNVIFEKSIIMIRSKVACIRRDFVLIQWIF